jgi:nucleoside-diphosphate-sugar epimerase
MNREKIYIIGGSGFIGSHTAKLFLEKSNYDIYIVDKIPPHRELYNFNKVNFIKCDITNIEQVKAALSGSIDYIFFLASIIRPEECRKEPYNSSNVNIAGLLNVLNFVIEKNIKKFIFSSSTHVYNTSLEEVNADLQIDTQLPQHIYPCFKLITEQLLRSYNLMYGLPYLNLRYSVAYGEYGHCDNVINRFIFNCLNGKPITLFNEGKLNRDFLHVSQHAKANYLSVSTNHINDTLCIGGEFVNILEAANIIKQMTNSSSEIILTKDGRLNDYKGKKINIEKTVKYLHWNNEISFKQGIQKTIDFYRR